MSKSPRQKFSLILGNNLFMLGKIIRNVPFYFILRTLHALMCGLLDFAGTLFTFHLLNEVSDGGSFLKAVSLIGLMAIIKILVYIYDMWFRELCDPSQKKLFHLRMHNELFEKSLKLDLACFDDPEFYNDFVWAMNESDTRAIAVMDSTANMIHQVISTTGVFSLLFSVEPLVAVILLVSSIITMISNILGNKESFNHSKETNPLWRKKDYINRVFHLADYSKELRISNASELLIDEYDKNTKEIIKTDIKYGKKYFLFYGVGWEALGNLTFFAILLYMVFGLKNGTTTIGTFAAAANVVWKIRWELVNLGESITQFVQHSLFIEKYREFLRFEPKIKGEKTDLPPFECLEFKDVSFTYNFTSHPKYKFGEQKGKNFKKETENYVLKNINLKFSAGEKIAIVGYNGAGKTTLIKLMMRLYDTTKGEILYNGQNIKNFEPKSYREKIGSVFQDYKIFAATVAQNAMNGIYDETKDKERVLSALNSADFKDRLSTLENGINTHLTREFNDAGINLSGGESQKVAIARVFANDFPIVIMDEPSSALDPMAEYNLNQSILNNTRDKTVIFISHRLSTTRIADKIYMFDNGELIEQGSHEELLEQNGKYAEMFKKQSEKYKEDKGALL